MKIIVIALLSLFSTFLALGENVESNSSTIDIKEIQPRQYFTLGVMVGNPNHDDYWAAKMPMITIDGDWTPLTGLFDAGRFGRNGAVDFGFFYGACHYFHEVAYGQQGLLQNTVDATSSFHFQFIPRLDTYSGVFGGVNIMTPTNKYQKATEFNGSLGMNIGAKYYFLKWLGAKVELAHDFLDNEMTMIAWGLSFRFGRPIE